MPSYEWVHDHTGRDTYTGTGIEFYKIPDSVLEHIGFNPRSDAYNNDNPEEPTDA
jgi:adenine-specific DNA-methyltransferase